MIGEYISALSNSAALIGKQTGYLVWGVKDDDHQIIWHKFSQVRCCINNKNWKAGFYKSAMQKFFSNFMNFYPARIFPVVILEIQAATILEFNSMELNLE